MTIAFVLAFVALRAGFLWNIHDASGGPKSPPPDMAAARRAIVEIGKNGYDPANYREDPSSLQNAGLDGLCAVVVYLQQAQASNSTKDLSAFAAHNLAIATSPWSGPNGLDFVSCIARSRFWSVRYFAACFAGLQYAKPAAIRSHARALLERLAQDREEAVRICVRRWLKSPEWSPEPKGKS